MRNFAKTLAVMGVLTPAGVNALGVGEIRLHSALNQKLLAEIPLLANSGEDVSQIRVRLAPLQAFAKAGLDRPHFLTNLRFKPVRKPDGSVVIQVTSTDVIREPFLDFLVEVEWPQGRMLREFTVLLDPPVTYDDVVKVVQSPPGVTPPPVQINRSAPAVADDAVRGPTVYGPVRPNESLWNIAQKLKPEPSITTEQMVMAIYRENPEAFLHGNVNSLQAGGTLKVPDRNTVMALSPRQARRQFQQHYRDWMARRTAAEAEPPAANGQESETRLKLEAPAEQTEVAHGQTEMPVIEGPAANPATSEALEALRAENQALKARIEALEKRMEALLELQSATLAKLQKETGGKPEETPQASSAAEPQAESRPEAKPKPAVAKKPKPQPVKPKTSPKPEPAEEPGLLAGLLDEPVYLSIGGGSLFLLAVAGFMIWRRRQAAAEQADSLLVAMDLETGEADAAEVSKEAAETVVKETEIPTPGVEVSESSFLSEFTPSDFDILETDDDAVDPIAEADVYLAYGRYQQAEELIKQALSEQPSDPTLRLKLLEIYYANEDSDAFRKYAQELQAAGAHNDAEFWSKVVEMAQELGLDDAIFVDGSPTDRQTADSGSTETALDLDLDALAEFSGGESESAEPEPTREAKAEFLDFDLNASSESEDESFDSATSDEEPGTNTDAGEANAISFEFEPAEPESDNKHSVEKADSGSEEVSEEIQGLDFDLGGIDLSETRRETAASSDEISTEAAGLEFSLTDEVQKAEPTGEGFDLTDMDELDTK
ncbi:MAG TPA: hypothetical protein ENI90_05300, partial [Methylothermaceae bacterium]|nr:hypothetical protein [Methylothermaceae bacterium]